jgi:transcription antitermination factor NusG
MRAWASTVATRLSGLGLDTEAALAPERAGSDATHLVLARSQRDVDGAHATISLSVDERHVEVAVQLPLLDVAAARARLTDPLRALELTTALEALPEQFAIGIAGDDEPAPASRASTDQVRALLARADREQRALWLGWSVSRAVATEHAELLEEQLQDAAVALASVFAILTSLSDGSKATGSETRRREKRERNRVDEDLRGTERRARKPGRLRERERDQEPEPDPREPAVLPAALQRTPGGGRPGHSAARARPGPAGRPTGSAREIEKGSRVRVLDGPFSGKVGVVQELDGRPGATGAIGADGAQVARVMLGLLAVRVDVRDLARCAEGRARPVLSTSHRKRRSVRS